MATKSATTTTDTRTKTPPQPTTEAGRVVAGGDKGELDVSQLPNLPSNASSVAPGLTRPNGSR